MRILQCKFSAFFIVTIHLIVFSPLLSQTHWETAIYAEDVWSYFVGTNAPPDNWNELSFDTSNWSSGQGGFGYADEDDNTVIPNTLSVFFRKSFNVPALEEILSLAIHADYDDGFVLYINGIEILRSDNMGQPGSQVAYDQTTDTDHEAIMYQGSAPEVFVLYPNDLDGVLNAGENVLAVEVHNVNETSSDMSGLFYLSFELSDGVSYYGGTPEWFYLPNEFSSSHLPIIVVNTNGQEIPNEDKITAHMGIIDNGPGEINYLSDPYNHYDGFIGIEIRGSSTTWFPKKQFAVETRDSLGENNNISLFGMPEENDWIFNAPYTDKSLMRNVIIYKMARDAGKYATRSHYFELVIDGDYRGLYVMFEKIKRDNNRVNISKLEPEEVSDDDITGGYIIKVDKWDGENIGGWYSEPPSDSYGGFYYQYHYPKPDEIVYDQQQYIMSYMENFEQTILSDDFANPETGYPSIINWDSFVDFFIMQEITKNVDGYRLSSFLHKDKDSDDGRLVAGPIWDFNLGFGNADYYNGWETQGWQVEADLPNDDFSIPYWWCTIWSDQSFRWSVQQRWNSLRNNFLSNASVNSLIDSLQSHIGEAADRNFERWPTLGQYVWPNYYIGQTYQDEIDYLRNWIITRMDWMDSELLSIQTEMCLIPEQFSMNPLYPNPFNRSVSIRYDIPLDSKIKLNVFNINGKHINTLFNGRTHAGTHSMSWNGLDKNGNIVSSGTYIVLLQANNFIYNQQENVNYIWDDYKETKKVILVK
ncbi:MAG: CotH kinase family protein [Candidatus Neomarinimicrobiota bacterium]|nr:CotH kinase family protein [Candidatus Neomarinimicrobiota bacterium]